MIELAVDVKGGSTLFCVPGLVAVFNHRHGVADGGSSEHGGRVFRRCGTLDGAGTLRGGSPRLWPDTRIPPAAPFAPNSHQWLETRMAARSDGGSNPPSSTNTLKANPNRLAFFCLLPRVCAGSCGFLRTAERAISASNRHLLLSVCVFSLRPAPPSTGRSPEGTPVTPI